MRRSSRINLSSLINLEARHRLRPVAASAEVGKPRCLACIRLRVSELYRSPKALTEATCHCLQRQNSHPMLVFRCEKPYVFNVQ